MAEFWKEIRCTGMKKDGTNCRHLLGKEVIFAGRIEIKCPVCNHVNTIVYRTPPRLLKTLVKEDLEATTQSKK